MSRREKPVQAAAFVATPGGRLEIRPVVLTPEMQQELRGWGGEWLHCPIEDADDCRRCGAVIESGVPGPVCTRCKAELERMAESEARRAGRSVA